MKSQLALVLLSFFMILSVQWGCKSIARTELSSEDANVKRVPVYDVKFFWTKDMSPTKSQEWAKLFLSPAVTTVPYAKRDAAPFRYSTDVQADGDEAFVVSGVNSNERLQRITSISGVNLETLQKRMYPWYALANGRGDWERFDNSDGGEFDKESFKEYLSAFDQEKQPEVRNQVLKHLITRKDYHASWQGIDRVKNGRTSGYGFIIPGHDLRSILIADNLTVLKNNLDHQRLAGPLLFFLEKIEKNNSSNEKSYNFNQGWGQYRVTLGKMGAEQLLVREKIRTTTRSGWFGYGIQGSPFHDELFANYIIYVTDPNDASKGVLRIDALTPHLIHRYGFYQDGPFRVAPEQIIAFFGDKTLQQF